MYQSPNGNLACTLRCARLIEGIIVMHQFAFGALAVDSFDAKDIVLGFIAVHLGMRAPTPEESERLEIMSYNSGASFAPEDAWEVLNLINHAFDEVHAIDCTRATLTIVGEYQARHGVTLQHIQDAAHDLDMRLPPRPVHFR